MSQDTRCWYYRAGWTCYRAGGNICYADTPTAINREHAILDADRCVAVNPSDTAPALIALDAQMVIRSARGERVVEAEDFFIGPGTDITRMTVLAPDELLTAIRIPATWAGAQFYFEKVRDRNVWDFPLLNVAAATTYASGRIERIRMVVNAAAARPLRLHAVEAAVVGQPRSEADGGARRADRHRGSAGASLQRLQDPVDAESGEAGHQGSGDRRNMDFVKWGLNPWGESILTHVSWTLFWASLLPA